MVGLRHLGGALARPPRTPNAVGHRATGYSLGVLSLTETGEPGTAAALHRDVLAGFAPRVLGRSLDFTFGPLDQEGVRAAFEPADYQGLTRLKAEHDPKELLHANHLIPPRTAAE